MHKKWLYRLILSYLPILFAVVFCLIILFFLTLNEAMERQTAQANGVYAENVLQIVDTTLRNLETTTIKSLLLEEKVGSYFDRPGKLDPYQDYGVAEVLLDFMSPLPMIDSVYLYRAADGKVLMQHFASRLTDFGDRSFIETAMGNAPSYTWSGIRDLQLFSGEDRPKSVISLVEQVPYFSGEQGLIVINVRKESLQALIQDMNMANTEICLKDAGGRAFAGADTCSDPQVQDRAVSRMSPYTGWTIKVGMARAEAFSLLSAFSNIWAILGFAAVVGGIAAMTYISHRNYRPIEQVMSRIYRFGEDRSFGWKPQSKEGDEFAFIGHALESLIEQTNSYEQQQAEGILHRRNQLFKELLENSGQMSADNWVREAERIGMDGEFAGAVVGIAEIDFYEAFAAGYSARDQALFKFTLRSVIQEISEKEGVSLWTEWIGPGRLGLLFRRSAGGENADGAAEKALMIAESACSWVKQHLKFTATFGISGPAAGLGGLSGAYRQALGALDRKITAGPGRVYAAPAGSPLPPAEGMDVLVQAIGAVPQLYRLGNAEWKPLIERIFELLAGGNYSKEDIVRLLRLLETGLSREMQELPPEMKGIWNNGRLRGIPHSPESFEWIEELHGELVSSLEEMEEALRSLRMNREQYTLANKVREYIGCNYADPDFSLTHVADSFAMNTKTVSRIFKEEIGENFVDYLARLRMEEAKRLLTGTSEPVQSIAERVGYLYPMSFIRVFKKLEGITPGEYRKAQGSPLRDGDSDSDGEG
ncbi:helix-turn-helix domain-containing protein [Paenibacillus sp. FSL R7-0302]|uniref:helix-turn-helix domain-containing protein n=1 Tax=Paenibacillus sp. FSL R7-0302 TaxID=2921681 RepID=UPI0030F9E1BE